MNADLIPQPQTAWLARYSAINAVKPSKIRQNRVAAVSHIWNSAGWEGLAKCEWEDLVDESGDAPLPALDSIIEIRKSILAADSKRIDLS